MLSPNTQNNSVFDISAYDFGSSPEECAESVIAQLCDKSVAPAFQIKKVLDQFGVILADDKMRPNREGALLKSNGKYVILTNKDYPYRQRKNFTKAHEMGHFFIKAHRLKPNYICNNDSIGSVNGNIGSKEAEANRFAQAFLLPLEPIQLITNDDNYDLSTIRTIATNYDVSLSVTVLRTIPMLHKQWYGVWAENGVVKWAVKSPSCHQLLIKRGSPIRKGSVAFKCFNENYKPYKNSFEKVQSDSWLIGVGNSVVHELTANLKKYNATLSILRFT
jgi:Zn-dependent peptidase ImmA (M78 family)